jgi:hypothetical protein
MSKKRDARIARVVTKKLKNEDKSVRLVQRVQTELPKERKPRLGADPGSIFNMQMAWHCDAADKAESWSWGQPRDWGDEAWGTLIEPKLSYFEKLLWR